MSYTIRGCVYSLLRLVITEISQLRFMTLICETHKQVQLIVPYQQKPISTDATLIQSSHHVNNIISLLKTNDSYKINIMCILHIKVSTKCVNLLFT